MLHPDVTADLDEETLEMLADYDPLAQRKEFGALFGEAKGLPKVDSDLLVSQGADADDFHESDLDGEVGE
jgi:hypothetical protein